MSSHLDNARKELVAQRNLLQNDIRQLVRQMKKIDQAIEHLAPVSTNGHSPRNVPLKDERIRRRDVVDTFYNDQRNGQQFDMPAFLTTMQEPEHLGRAYAYLVRIDDRFKTVKPGLWEVVK